MNTPTVLLHMDDPEPALAFAKTQHPDVKFVSCDTYAKLPEAVATSKADVVYSLRFAGTKNFPTDALINSETVKWVSVAGSGTDHLAGWDPAHVTVTNAAGVAADMMAEYTIGAVLSFSLDLAGFRRAQAARHWGSGQVRPIAGQTMLIIGMGATGSAIADRAKAMGMHVIAVRARPTPAPNVDEVFGTDAIDTVLPRADAVAICVPLLDSTRDLLSAARIAALKPSAVLVDVSRGGVVDQTALAEALSTGRLRGAALDVFETEPLPASSPFWALENVILTPHCSSVYEGWELKSVSMFCENLARYIAGDPLTNVVDPVRGY